VLALGLALASQRTGNGELIGIGLALLVAGPLAGAGLGWIFGSDWRSAARAVDEAFQLKDCTASALEFGTRPAASAFHELTCRDAVRHLEHFRPIDATPLRLPRSAPWAVIALVGALLLLLRPLPQPAQADEPAAVPEAVQNEADLIEQYAANLGARADEENLPELKKLAEEMKKTTEKMRQPGTDIREALAYISELQQALACMKAELNAQVVEGQLKDLASAMREAPPLEPAGKAIQDTQLEQAARMLEKVAGGERAPPATGAKPASADPKEARANRAASEKMQQLAREMARKKLEKLGKASEKLAEGLKGDDKKMKEGAKQLADEVRQQERRQRINEMLAREDQRLQDCKSRCQKQNLFANKDDKSSSGSNANQRTDARPQRKQGKNKASRSAGKKSSDPGRPDRATDDPAGDEQPQGGTPPDPSKDPGGKDAGEENPQPGDAGPSRAAMKRRLPAEKYRQARRLSEDMIENEAIPLGYRETIRKYFELLQPAAYPDDAPPKPGTSK
jgi:hypothetical protein